MKGDFDNKATKITEQQPFRKSDKSVPQYKVQKSNSSNSIWKYKEKSVTPKIGITNAEQTTKLIKQGSDELEAEVNYSVEEKHFSKSACNHEKNISKTKRKSQLTGKWQL